MMAVHDAIHRAVEGRRIARVDHQAAIERLAAEIRAAHEAAAGTIPADATHSLATQEGPTNDNT